MTAIFLAVAILFGYAAGCTGDQSKEASITSVNLINIHEVAKIYRDTGRINPRWHLRNYNFEKGWLFLSLKAKGLPPTAMATAPEALFRYQVVKPSPRRLIFKIKAQGELGGPEKQHLEIFAGDTQLAEVDLKGTDEQQMQVVIPAKSQQFGDNRLRFHFENRTDNPNFLKKIKNKDGEKKDAPGNNSPFVYAYLSEFTILPGDNAGPSSEKARDEVQTVTLVAEGRYLSQKADSSLVYTFDILDGSSLALEGTISAESGTADAIVSLRTDERPEWREIWRDQITADGKETARKFKANLSLKEMAGQCVQIRFDVFSDEITGRAAVVWKRMELIQPERKESLDSTRFDLPGKEKKYPNVVIIVLDAARADYFGCNGGEGNLTPAVDEFSHSAILFKNAITAASFTPSSVATLFTGLYPYTHGLHLSQRQMPEDFDTMPKAFKRAGYFTIAMVGNVFLTKKYGVTRDFDKIRWLRSDQTARMNLGQIKQGITEAAISGKPSFIYVHILPPHIPYNPPFPFNRSWLEGIVESDTWLKQRLLAYIKSGLLDEAGEYLKKLNMMYRYNLSYADYVAGEIIENLKKNDLYDNSLVIVTADHGEAFGEHGLWGHEVGVWDEMIEIPLIMKLPGKSSRRTIEQQVSLVDLFPTLIEYANLPADVVDLPGGSLVALMDGKESAEPDYYFISSGFIHLTGEKLPFIRAKFAYRGERFKYVCQDFDEALYDIVADPGETENLIDKYPVLAGLLRQRGYLNIASSKKLNSGEEPMIELTEKEKNELRNLGYIQ